MEEEDLLAVEADPLESEPQSDEENIVDSGVFSPEFVATTGVRVYLAACEREGIVPVQQFIVMMDQESVSLKHRGLGAAGGVALFECLRANTCIHALDLEDNQLGLGVDPDSGGLDHISRALADNKLLMLLDLSYNNLSSRGCAAISSALSTSSITDLSLRGNSMGDLGALAFSKALASNRTITKLDVSDNNIDEAGSVALASLLVKCEKLRFADFSWNSIRLAGAQALTTALKESKVVRLNLAWNGLGDRGAKSLAGALAENTELQFLDISKNNLREEAASALAACLAHNSTLRSLQLNGNPLTDRGVGKILQAIGINCSVRDLSLHGVALERSGVGLFDPLNPTGRFTLDLSDPFDRSIFANHLELDRQDEASGIDNFLNVALNGKPLELADGQELSDWKAPAQGTLTYDYVSGKRVPRDARAQRDTVFASFHRELASSLMASDAERLVSLRTACITHFFTCAQAKELLLLFGYTERADAAIILFRRCVDPQHFGLIWDLLSPAERAALQERLDEALTPYLPEEVAVPIFLTEMEVAAQTEANPLEVELETSWQALLPALKAALAAAVTADIGAECDGLRKELGRHYSQLRAVYKFYAASDEREAGADSEALFNASELRLSVRELWHFCKACRLTSRRLPLSAVDKLFIVQATQVAALDMGELELSLSDFILGLIKLALMYRALGLGPSDESDSGADGYESSGPPPAHRVLAWLLREKVLRHGKKEDLDAFRKEFWAPTVQNAINPYWYPLKAVFDKWKAADNSEGNDNRTMSMSEFCAMLKTKELLDYSELPESLKMAEAVEAFHLAQAASGHSAPAGVVPGLDKECNSDADENTDDELIFIEFVEAIGRCALKSIDEDIGPEYADMPLSKRLVIFIQKLLR